MMKKTVLTGLFTLTVCQNALTLIIFMWLVVLVAWNSKTAPPLAQ